MSRTDPNGLHYDIMNLVFCDSLTGFIIDFNTAEPILYKLCSEGKECIHCPLHRGTVYTFSPLCVYMALFSLRYEHNSCRDTVSQTQAR